MRMSQVMKNLLALDVHEDESRQLDQGDDEGSERDAADVM